MALNIKNPETTRLARQLAVLLDVREIRAFVASLPDLDSRSADELLGYDDFGLPA